MFCHSNVRDLSSVPSPATGLEGGSVVVIIVINLLKKTYAQSRLRQSVGSEGPWPL